MHGKPAFCLHNDPATTSTNNIMKTVAIAFGLLVSMFVLGSGLSNAQKPGKAPVKSSIDKGDFIVGFSPKTLKAGPKPAIPKDEKAILQGVATELNALIALPRNVYLNFDKCGEANAFYSSATTEITICYELIQQYENEFKTISTKPSEIDNMVEDTILQTFFHELGHCLIDVWDMPATGREEDAVDQLATVLMLDGSPEGVDSAINAALEFQIASQNDEKGDMIFWDEHSFSKTRFYDMLCLVYGSDPKKNAILVGPDRLPAERAQRCTTEYKRAEHAWMKLLTPYIL